MSEPTAPETPVTAEAALGAWLGKLQLRLAMALLGRQLMGVADGGDPDLLSDATYFTTACIIAAGRYPEWAQGLAALATQAAAEVGGPDAVLSLADKLVHSLPIEVHS